MKICYFNDYRLGVIKGDNVVDVTDAVKDIPHLDSRDLIVGLIARWDAYKAKVEKAAAEGKGVPVSGVKLRPPVPKPGNIVCMAVNYMEDGTLPEKPAINAFHKAATAVIGDGDTMVLPDAPATIFEGEAEMALVIGTVMQKFNTSDMAHHIPRIIEWVSSIHTLEPGDIVATGTNHRGLNSFMDGDKIELTVEKIGTLKFGVKDELKRTWARTTRLQHKEKGGEGPHTPQLTGKYAK